MIVAPAAAIRASRLKVFDIAASAAAGLGLLLMAFAPAPAWLAGILVLAASVALCPWLASPAIIATLPFYLHPRTVMAQEVSLTEAAVLAATAAVIARTATMRGRTRGKADDAADPAIASLNRTVVEWPLLALLAAALVSLAVTEYPKQSLRELRWLIVEPVVVFYLARLTLNRPWQQLSVIWVLAAAGAVGGLMGLGELAMHGELLRSSARATAPYLSPNQLGMFLERAGCAALALALFLSPRLRTAVIAAMALLVPILLTLVRTLSVGAWAGFFASTIAITGFRSRRTAVIAVAATVVAAIGLFALLPSERTLGRWDPTSGTALFRVEIWTAAAHMIADHPVLGIGLDNFLYAYQSGYMQPEAWREPTISHPHNWVLDFWLQLGIIGLVAFVVLLIWAIRRAVRLLRSADTTDHVVGATALGATVALVVHGSVDNSYFLVDSATVWWLMLALLTIRYPENHPRAGVPDRAGASMISPHPGDSP